MTKKIVECANHGPQDAAFVCIHLVKHGKDRPIGFYQADIDPDNRDWDDLQAWCKECDEVLDKVGEWNDESEAFSNIQLVCNECFEEMKRTQLRLHPQNTAVE